MSQQSDVQRAWNKPFLSLLCAVCSWVSTALRCLWGEARLSRTLTAPLALTHPPTLLQPQTSLSTPTSAFPAAYPIGMTHLLTIHFAVTFLLEWKLH